MPFSHESSRGDPGPNNADEWNFAQRAQEQGHLPGGFCGRSADQEDDGEVPPESGGARRGGHRQDQPLAIESPWLSASRLLPY